MVNTEARHFIGIDPSLNGTGLAVLTFDGDQTRRVTLLIAPSTALAEPYKLAHIYRIASEWIIACTPGHIAGACMEGPSYGSKGRQDILSEVRGVLKLVLVQRPRLQRLNIIAPTSLKKFASGFGGADKEQVAEGMRKLGWHANSSDEYDAAALAEFCYAQCNDNPQLSRTQKEALVPKKKPAKKKFFKGYNV